jgi:hypothetical protein
MLSLKSKKHLLYQFAYSTEQTQQLKIGCYETASEYDNMLQSNTKLQKSISRIVPVDVAGCAILPGGRHVR